MELEDRFWAKVQKSDGCWEWMDSPDSSGYGRISVNGILRQAHRVAWEIHHGPIPDGLCVLHRCDNPPCVRPDHLFLGTVADNNLDMIRKGRGRFGMSPARGEAHGNSKLTEQDVMDIRARIGQTHAQIAAEFGVSESAIEHIRAGRNWKHLLP